MNTLKKAGRLMMSMVLVAVMTINSPVMTSYAEANEETDQVTQEYARPGFGEEGGAGEDETVDLPGLVGSGSSADVSGTEPNVLSQPVDEGSDDPCDGLTVDGVTLSVDGMSTTPSPVLMAGGYSPDDENAIDYDEIAMARRDDLQPGWYMLTFSYNGFDYEIPMNPGNTIPLGEIAEALAIPLDYSKGNMNFIYNRVSSSDTDSMEASVEYLNDHYSDYSLTFNKAWDGTLTLTVGKYTGITDVLPSTYAVTVSVGPLRGCVSAWSFMRTDYNNYPHYVKGGGSIPYIFLAHILKSDEYFAPLSDQDIQSIGHGDMWDEYSDYFELRCNSAGKYFFVAKDELHELAHTYVKSCHEVTGSSYVSGLLIGTDTMSGTGTENDPILIDSLNAWKKVADDIRFGINAEKFYKLTENIGNEQTPITDIIGTDSSFNGVLDGNGKTVYVAISNAGSENTALFGKINGAVIKDLAVEGTVSGGNYSAGLVSWVEGTGNIISNCVVNTNVTAIGNNGRAIGGVIGKVGSSSVTLENIKFGGTLSNNGDYAGGMIGLCDSGANLSLDSCLFDGTVNDLSHDKFHPVVMKKENTSITAEIKNVYYTLEPTITSEENIVTDPANISTVGSVQMNEPAKMIYKEVSVFNTTVYEPVSITGMIPFYAYTGNDLVSTILSSVTTEKANKTAVLTKEVDYTVSFKKLSADVDEVTDKGTYKVTFTAIGNYSGSESFDFIVGDSSQLGEGLITWSKLQTAMGVGGDISLNADVIPGVDDIDSYLYIPEGVTVNLDLNGHTIDRGLNHGKIVIEDSQSTFEDPDSITDGFVIRVDGTLIINDSIGGGKITGGNNKGTRYGGGLYITEQGTCTMNGGSICGNYSKSEGGGVFVQGKFIFNGGTICDNMAYYGGGIEVNDRTLDDPERGLYMYGGVIEHNYAVVGGGIEANGIFFMYDGIIRENNALTIVYPQYDHKKTAGIGGGVVAYLTFEMYGGQIIDNTSTGAAGGIRINNGRSFSYTQGISGCVTIIGNTLTNGAASNLALGSSGDDPGYADIAILGQLDSSSRVAITGRPLGGRAVTEVSEKGSLSNFISDESEYELTIIDGDLWTVRKAATVIQKPSVDGFDWVKTKVMEYTYSFEPGYGYRRGVNYKGRAQELLSDPGMAMNGTMVYALGGKDTPPENSAFSETIPMGTYVGVYYIWYKAKGNEGYTDSAVEGPLMIDIFPGTYHDRIFIKPYSGDRRSSDSFINSVCSVEPDTPTPLSSVISQFGCNAEIVDAQKNNYSEYVNLYQIDGVWMVNCREGDYKASVIISLSNGYTTEISIMPCRKLNCVYTLTLFPGYGDNEPTYVSVDKNGYFLPDMYREGYRFIGWKNAYSSRNFEPGTLINCNYNGFFITNDASIIFKPRYNEAYLEAQWEPIDGNPLLTAIIDNLAGGDAAEEIFMGGQHYIQIGKGDGKKLLISKEALETDSVSDVEKAAMIDTSWLYARYESERTGQPRYVAEEKIEDHGKVFDLTFTEICRYLPSIESRKAGASWTILRESINHNNNDPNELESVTEEGLFDDSYVKKHRYAFVLDDSYVFLSSVYDGIKPAADGEFGTFTPGTGIQKLTLLDNGRDFAAYTEISAVNAGGDINITFSGAESGENEYVSCMLFDASGNLKGYASLDTQGNPDGTWDITIPSDTSAGKYCLKLFSEQRNGDRDTDYVSVPVVIPIKVVNGTVQNVTINGDDSVIYGDSIVLSAQINGEDANDEVIWSSLDVNVATVDDSGKVTTVHAGEATIIAESSNGMSSKKIVVTQKTVEIALLPGETVYTSTEKFCPKIIVTNLMEGDECSVFTPFIENIFDYQDMFKWANYTSTLFFDETDSRVYLYKPVNGYNYLNGMTLTLSNSDYKLPDVMPVLSFAFIPRTLELEWGNDEFIYNGEEKSPTVLAKGFYDFAYLDQCLPPDRNLKVIGGETNVGIYEASAVAEYSDDFVIQYRCRWEQAFYTNEDKLILLPSDLTHTFTILPKTVGLDWSSTESSYEYTGNAVTPIPDLTGLCGTDICDVTVGKIEKLGADGSTWSEVTEAKEKGSYKATVTALGNDNYALPLTGLSYEFEIKESITPVVTIDAGTYTYNGNAQTPSFTVLKEAGGEALASSDYEYEFANNVNAGNNATLTVRSAANGEYIFDPVAVTFTIGKATHEDETVSSYVICDVSANDIQVTLPALPDGVSEYGTPVVNGDLIDGTPVVSETTLTYSVTAQNAGESATITLAVAESDNYEAYGIIVTVTAVDKAETDVSIFRRTNAVSSSLGAVYGDEAFRLTALAADTGSNGTFSWSSNDTSVAAVSDTGVVTVKGAGTAVIKASYDSNMYFGYKEITLNVSRKVLGLTWGDTSFIFDGKAKKPAVMLSGVIDGDDCSVSVVGEQTDVGEDYTALAVLSGDDKDNYMLLGNKTCSFTIKKKPEPANPGKTDQESGNGDNTNTSTDNGKTALADQGNPNLENNPSGRSDADTSAATSAADAGASAVENAVSSSADTNSNAQSNTSGDVASTVVSNDTQKPANAVETTAAGEGVVSDGGSAQEGSADVDSSDSIDSAPSSADQKSENSEAVEADAEVSISEEKKSGPTPWQYGLMGTGAVVVVSGAALFTKKRFGFKFK